MQGYLYVQFSLVNLTMSSLMLKLVETAESSSVRGMIGPAGLQIFSVYDFMTVACGYKDAGAGARKEFKRLTNDDSTHREEIVASCHSLHFPGQRGPGTPCMTIRGLQRLLMILGGKVAAEFRKLVEGTFTRIMAGDQSLIEVINANAASQDPVQQAYRASLAQEPVDPVLDDFCLKRKREREDLLFSMEMAERKLRLEETQLRLEDGKLALEERKLHHETKLIEHVNTSMGSINALKDWANVDERTKLQAEDHIKNLLFNKLAAVPADTTSPSASSTDSPTSALNVSILAKELGFKCSEGELQRIGREMAKKYRETYKCNPSKHKQFVGGNFIPVNSYMERDRSLMELVIRTVMSQPAV